MKTKTCPRCLATFECGADADSSTGSRTCWCVSLPVLPNPDFTASCFCRECLTKELGERTEPPKN